VSGLARVARLACPAMGLWTWFSICAVGALTGCGEDLPPKEQVAAACREWAEVGCRKNHECVGLRETMDACIAQEEAECLVDAEKNGPTCYENLAEALADCAPRLEATTCAQYCSTSQNGSLFCFSPCFYYCPG
jgi:hypothetical protein